MKKFVFFLLILLSAFPALAQNAREYVLQVVPESAFIRLEPDEESTPTASVFANNSLIAVGRNIDGEWLEVRRPGRQDGIGWIARRLTAFTFDLALLPITDLTTGLVGEEPVVNTGFAVLTISEGSLRTAADRFSTELALIPVGLTLPVLERTPDNQWLKINYRGMVGWMSEFETRTSSDLNTIPISPEYAGSSDFPGIEIIPYEVQIAQVDSLIAYIDPIYTQTNDVVYYWKQMSLGETLECVPPAGGYAYFAPAPRDVVELPELRRQRRLLTQAVDDINASIEAMQRCGVYTQSEIRTAYANALNAQTIFEVVNKRMEDQREKLGG
jgi:hypothetical protein